MILFLTALLITITIHELAHFVASKLVKCEAEVVSIGFGKPIYSFYRGNTRYNISPILLGGYVKLEGELEQSDSPTAFMNLTYTKKIIITLAGCFVNLLFGFGWLYLGSWLNNYMIFYVGFFNIITGLGNLLPIPGLDGSYPIMVWLEKLIGKEKSTIILKKVVTIIVRVLLIINALLLPWFLIKGVPLLKQLIILYWEMI